MLFVSISLTAILIALSSKLDDISEMNETEKAQYKINRATIKTDCMVDYFNKRDLGQIDTSYEEHCK